VWQGRAARLIGPVAALALVAAGQAVLAGAGAHPVLVGPGSYGVVDLGDRVPYRLAGAGCLTDTVRIVVTAGRAGGRVHSAPSAPTADPLRPDSCAGAVTVPTETQVRTTGWRQGDPIAITVESDHSRVPLRYLRVEADQAEPAAGGPSVVPAADPRSPKTDHAMLMSAGDAIDLGRVDLTKINAVSVRACLTGGVPVKATPIMFTLHQDSPDGPAIVGPRDIASDMFVGPWNDSNGWVGCYFLAPSEITGTVAERAPHLFASIDAASSPVLVNFIDFNGTGAKLPERPPRDPRGTQLLFDGSSFKGWDQSGCALRDGAVRTAGYPGGCSMTYARRQLHDVLIRLSFRLENFNDNGGIYVGGTEIQMRQAGEWLIGGYYGPTRGQSVVPSPAAGCNFNFQVMFTYTACGYPANVDNVNVFPDWNQMEILQLGAHYVVRVNGRTVTDTYAADGDPGKFALQLVTQPEFAFRYGVGGTFQEPWPPRVEQPDSWGNEWFDNVRVYRCHSRTDRVCTRDHSDAGIG
jgi:hypothetical protein